MGISDIYTYEIAIHILWTINENIKYLLVKTATHMLWTISFMYSIPNAFYW